MRKADEERLAKMVAVIRYLHSQGYRNPTFFHDDDPRWVAVAPFAYTHAIIVGDQATYDLGYEDRWCYQTYEEARIGLVSWMRVDGAGEPQGWHRHPATGRRRNVETGEEWITR